MSGCYSHCWITRKKEEGKVLKCGFRGWQKERLDVIGINCLFLDIVESQEKRKGDQKLNTTTSLFIHYSEFVAALLWNPAYFKVFNLLKCILTFKFPFSTTKKYKKYSHKQLTELSIHYVQSHDSLVFFVFFSAKKRSNALRPLCDSNRKISPLLPPSVPLWFSMLLRRCMEDVIFKAFFPTRTHNRSQTFVQTQTPCSAALD